LRMRGILIAIGLFAFATPAWAAVLPIEGIYGTPDGCEFFMSGDLDLDDIVVLTPDTFTARGRGCFFEELLESIGDDIAISATCHADMEYGSTTEIVRVIDNAPNGITVELIGLGEYGPLFPCPGTEGLLRRGVQI
jgi:hypothetical protein